MKKVEELKDEMRTEYDFASMRGGVRGKYVERLRRESNVVVLAPEVAAAFPTGDSLNAALRGILDTARTVRSHGGLPNTTLQPTSCAPWFRLLPVGSRAARGRAPESFIGMTASRSAAGVQLRMSARLATSIRPWLGM
jgi:hypothetical protein